MSFPFFPNIVLLNLFLNNELTLALLLPAFQGTPQFVTSNRGNKHILLGGYKFGIHKTKGLKTRWLCTAHNSKACYASLMTIENQVISMTNYHTHWIQSNCCKVLFILLIKRKLMLERIFQSCRLELETAQK